MLQPPPDTGDNPPHCATVTAALYAAAKAAYGSPSPGQLMPAAVRVHGLSLHGYTAEHPDWASQSLQLVEVARLKG